MEHTSGNKNAYNPNDKVTLTVKGPDHITGDARRVPKYDHRGIFIDNVSEYYYGNAWIPQEEYQRRIDVLVENFFNLDFDPNAELGMPVFDEGVAEELPGYFWNHVGEAGQKRWGNHTGKSDTKYINGIENPWWRGDVEPANLLAEGVLLVVAPGFTKVARSALAAAKLSVKARTRRIILRTYHYLKRNKYTIDLNKYDYFFGRVVTGTDHNIVRSAQNLADLTEMGITSELQLARAFDKAFSAPEIRRIATEHGTTVIKKVNVREVGSIEVSFFYEGGDMSLIPRISTIIPKIHH